MSGISFITASMAMPFSDPLIGLATGLSISMRDCTIPFNFAFVQGGKNRIDALSRGTYNFIIISKEAAKYHTSKNPNLETFMILNNSRYSNEYMFFSYDKDIATPQDGMRIAVDPKATDQFVLTNRLCQGKNVEIVHCAFSACISMFLEKKVDAVVYHKEHWIEAEHMHTHKIESGQDMYIPAIVTAKGDKVIQQLIKTYIADISISKTQQDVTNKKIYPQFC